jgi:hypothetical protein
MCPCSALRGASALRLPGYAHAGSAMQGLDSVLLACQLGQRNELHEASSSSSWRGISSGATMAATERRQRGHDATRHEETIRRLQGMCA